MREARYDEKTGTLTLIEDGRALGSWVGVHRREDYAEPRIVGNWILGIRDGEVAVRELDTLCVR